MGSLSIDSSVVEMRAFASTPEILRCFDEHKPLLTRLALLITGDESVAARCLASARENTLRSHSPFRNWILEWAKTATIQIALLRSAPLIRGFERAYSQRACTHAGHLSDEKLRSGLGTLMQVEPHAVISNLDPLSRAVLVLRTALGSSIQECALRLNVSRLAVLGANCRAMAWLGSMRT